MSAGSKDSAQDLKSRLDLAISAGREAGQLTLKYFCADDLNVELKSDNSPVTVADRQAELLLRERISAAFPDDAILGEEFQERPGTSGYRWILDPIDGTKSFVHGVPMYGTMVGIERDGQSVIGVVYIPPLDECVYAGIGLGAWHTRLGQSARKAVVSRRDKLADALFVTTAVRSFTEWGRQETYELLEARTRMTRTWGDCYGYLLVATGRADVMIDPVMNVWDAAAIYPIMVEAGGTFTDWQGEPTIHSHEGIATNGLVLEEVLAVTRAAARLK